MLYSHASGLGIRAVLFLAVQPPGKLSPVHEIARGTGLPEPYLAKILGRLTAAGLVRAFRGPGGGFELGRSPDAISLWSVVRAIEGPAQKAYCALGLPACSEENPCSLHHRWAAVREQIQRMLEETTLAALAPGLRKKAEQGEKSWEGLSEEAAAGRPSESGKQKAR